MPVYLCRWPNGDFSVVSAANKDVAIELLDEVGNAEGCPIVTIKEFMVHFGLTDSGELEFQSYGETTENRIMEWGYPVLDEAWMDASEEALTKEQKDKLIQDAVEAERKRIVHKPREPETGLGRDIKRLTDAPARQIDRIIKGESRKSKVAGQIQRQGQAALRWVTGWNYGFQCLGRVVRSAFSANRIAKVIWNSEEIRALF